MNQELHSASSTILIFGIALFLTVIFSFVVERLWVKPKAPQFNRKTPLPLFLIQSLLVSLVFIAITLIVQRPIFAGLAVSIFLIILNGVSNAKFHALKEPMVFSDIAMFSQAFKHPRLYFPFLGLVPVIAMPLIIILLIYTVLTLEPGIEITWARTLISLIAIAFYYLAAQSIAQTLKLNEDPAVDNHNYGLINSLFSYAIQARTSEHKNFVKNKLLASAFATEIRKHSATETITETNHTKRKRTNDKPPPHFLDKTDPDQQAQHITVIQSESFFDARRMHDSINNDVLKHYNDCLNESTQFGKLSVPAWGANTMRTEFSFLTGINYKDMGLYRYYPYQFLHKMPIVSLAKVLQSRGYHCVCIHPHPASFFGRDRIFPQMGFDEFIDIENFDTEQTFGPYISDQAVTDKVLATKQKYIDKPLFIFAITMENHGPLHLEKTTKDEQNTYFSKAPIEQANDLTVYLRHLKNADNMVKQLTSTYRESDKSNTLCFYGDHIPSMPNIYQELGYEDKDSDYFIWNNNQTINIPTNTNISVDCLAEILLKQTHII